MRTDLWFQSNSRTFCSVSADQFAVRFVPKENGVHSIDVRFNGSHVPGSPFKIRVGEPGQVGDPGLVSAFGPGLEGGTTGRTYTFILKLFLKAPNGFTDCCVNVFRCSI